MTQENPLNLAKKGNARAIAFLLNRQLQPKGIIAKVTLEDGCLQIMLEGANVPPQEVSVKWLQNVIMILQINRVEQLIVYGRQTGVKVPEWSEKVDFPSENHPHDKIYELSSKGLIGDNTVNASSLKQRAQQGDITALTSLLALPFNKKGIIVTATIKDGLLQVMLESERIPNEDTCLRIMRRELINLNSETIQLVKVYGQKLGVDFPTWHRELELINPSVSPSVETSTIASHSSHYAFESCPLPTLESFNEEENVIRRLKKHLTSWFTPESSTYYKISRVLLILTFFLVILSIILWSLILVLSSLILGVMAGVFYGNSPEYKEKQENRKDSKISITTEEKRILSTPITHQTKEKIQENNLITQGLLNNNEKIIFSQSASYRGGIKGYPKDGEKPGHGFLLDTAFVFYDEQINWKIGYTSIINVRLDFFKVTLGRKLFPNGEIAEKLQKTKNILVIHYCDNEDMERVAKFQIHGAFTMAGEELKATEFLNFFREFQGEFFTPSTELKDAKLMVKLEKLKQLKDSGIITEYEFLTKKQKLLDKF